MSSRKWVVAGLATVMAVAIGIKLHAQTFTSGTSSDSASARTEPITMKATDMAAVQDLSEAELAAFISALDATPQISYDAIPNNGISTYYSLQHPDWAPLPANLSHSPVWQMDHFFLLDDIYHRYPTLTSVQTKTTKSGGTTTMTTLTTMTTMDTTSPPSPGDGTTNTYVITNSISYTTPDYGTNLYLAQVSLENGYFTAIASNTLPDVQYEIQTNANLTTTNWGPFAAYPFFYGSTETNWTPLDAIAVNPDLRNLFFRLRSGVSSDGSGLPDWWEQKYGVTDPYGDPDGDGWNNLQEYQNGTDPNVFDTPPAPQGLTLGYNADGTKTAVSWNPSPGLVTNYLVTVTDWAGNVVTNYNVNPDQLSIAVDDSGIPAENTAPTYFGHNLTATYQVTAQYASGDSAPTINNPLQGYAPYLNGTPLISDAQGTTYLVLGALPPGTSQLRVVREDVLAEDHQGDYSQNVTHIVPIANLVNGMVPIPSSWMTTTSDTYGYNLFNWWIEMANSNGAATATSMQIAQTTGNDTSSAWLVPPVYDGRTELKQNLIFQLRAALASRPFQYSVIYTNSDGSIDGSYFITGPTNHAYAGFYNMHSVDQDGYPQTTSQPKLDAFLPFAENYFDRNFVFDSSLLDANGRSTTGVGGSEDSTSGLTILSLSGYGDNLYALPLAYQFPYDSPPTNGTEIPALLPGNQTQSLTTYPFDSGMTPRNLGLIGATNVYANEQNNYILESGARNWFGLRFLSAKLGHAGPAIDIIDENHSSTNSGYLYPETKPPQFQLVEYDFWNPTYTYFDEYGHPDAPDLLPGQDAFEPSNVSNPCLLVGVGSSLTVAGYAKLEVTNSAYTGVYGYLGQYFDQAYQIDENGNVTTNTTGVLSPYGNFFATEPGPTALVTMPEVDTGERGTCTVYSVSLQLDKNHDGVIDTSFNGADVTSAADPMILWANNDYDRGHTVDITDHEEDDLLAAGCPYTPNVPTPDYAYRDVNGYQTIPSMRDLEDYFRLWLPGMKAVMKAMPTNYTVQLTLTGDAQIRIFQAIEPDGGTNYLFDETTASNQVAQSASLYVGLLTSSSPVVFSVSTNFNEHFIFCGAQTGTAQVDLQVLDGNQNVVVDAPAHMEIKDIKQMYERWTVGDSGSQAPWTNAQLAVEDLPVGSSAFQYPYNAATDTNTPYILLVHGWNMETWEKDRYAETAYKRLYWQGYQGRFGFYRWPTGNDFPGTFGVHVLTDARNYNNSESNAWASAVGLTNLLTQLYVKYPGNVYLIAHSMGNVVAGEAMRLAGSQLVNTYVAMQGAVPAHSYDAAIPNRSTYSTPDRYANYYTDGSPCYFSSSAGAGTYVNFYNTNDYALSWWNVDQDQKPDNGLGGIGVNYPGYFYSTSSGFYKIAGTIHYLNFPTNTYEIFPYADPAWSCALGAQADVGGVFKKGSSYQEVDLPSVWPTDTHPHQPGTLYSAHVWHSAEFRSDNMSRAKFWNTLMNRIFP